MFSFWGGVEAWTTQVKSRDELFVNGPSGPTVRGFFFIYRLLVTMSGFKNRCVNCFYPRSVLRNNPPRNAVAENQFGNFKPTCCFSLIFSFYLSRFLPVSFSFTNSAKPWFMTAFLFGGNAGKRDLEFVSFSLCLSLSAGQSQSVAVCLSVSVCVSLDLFRL